MGQPIVVSERQRPFPTYPVAVQTILMDEQMRVLMLTSRPTDPYGGWQIISGGLEGNEAVLAAAIRETHEEAGPDLQIRPLGIVHVQTFNYDNNIPMMIGVYVLMAYEGGPVVPGDDMAESEYRWWNIDEIDQGDVPLHPSTHLWMLKRAALLKPILEKEGVAADILQPLLREV